jgi:sphinganine-1-phosphate aldolase
MGIPNQGKDKKAVFEALEAFRKDDLDWRSGRAFGYIFDPGKEIMAVGKEAYGMYLSENGLDFTVFLSLLKLEKELAAMMAGHLSGDDAVVGNFTSGGTESIILAVKAARDHFRRERPEITAPEIVMPTTAHAAFHKAAHYLGLAVVSVPVDPKTFRAVPGAMAAAVTENSIMLVGSAPSYAHGVVDPIEELGKIALAHDLWLHTDACMGGFLLPYFKRLGRKMPDFDFSVPGVRSISVDLHKYAYCPKGASLVLYRNKTFRKSQIFACSRWVGYTIVNNAVQSSKSGGPMAAAWAVLNYVGDEGYLDIAKQKLEAVDRLCAGIDAIPGLRRLAEPDMSLISFASDTAGVFHIIDEMNRLGWYIQPALSYDNSPAHIHLSVSAANVAWVDPFLKDLEACTASAAKLPVGQLAKALAQGTDEGGGVVDFSGMGDEELSDVLAMAGIGKDGLPDRMAEINQVLDILPAKVREELLTTFVNDLFS